MSEVVELLYSHRQLHNASVEAGGILLGQRRGQHIVVTNISEPGPDDISLRTRFERKGDHHQQEVDKLFKGSGGYVVYLGEWHTHPENIPQPSCIDITSWRTGLKSAEPLIMLIVGIKGVWLGSKRGNDIKKIEEK
ncbi:Mov34/MPN/PAD-1 family protein [Leclercia adecarboxylata]|uniref:Mov34/MPN/PAD-1 family protein n=1 Tax=Leclercia adecarboxylata TaxID=83655 RepID=UPI001CB8A90C|nr:Mov34/MPN/PAD-1 family protein [Leclercia adecarboxylata]